MIKSFADKRTLAIFKGSGVVRRFPPDLQRAAQRKLVQLDHIQIIDQLRLPPGNRLEKLSGNRAGSWSIRINDQWRICFRWQEDHAWDVEIVDYH